MRRLSWEDFAALAPEMSGEQRRAAAIAGAAHALHDGYTDLIYILLPLWQAEFGLTYAALGALRSVFVGAMACPANSRRPCLRTVRRRHQCWRSARRSPVSAIASPAPAPAFVMLLGALLISGIGASTQHPIASALVARAFAGPRSLKALGTYNFAGDIGKMTLPAALSLMLLVMAWRPALAILGGLGVAMAVVIFIAAPRYEHAARPPRRTADAKAGRRSPSGIPLPSPCCCPIGIIDSATRMGFLLFLPFVLRDKGATVQTVGLAMTLVFAGGAAGKLACAFIGARIGAIGTVWLTEGFTAAGILALLPLPLDGALMLLPVIGIALNGTSSVLYGSVPDLVAPQRRTRALEHFLYRHDRLRRDRAGAVWPCRRRGRGVAGLDAGRRLRAADACRCRRCCAARWRRGYGSASGVSSVNFAALEQVVRLLSGVSSRGHAELTPILANSIRAGTADRRRRVGLVARACVRTMRPHDLSIWSTP